MEYDTIRIKGASALGSGCERIVRLGFTPNIGDILNGAALGKISAPTSRFVYLPCENCQAPHWVRLKREGKPATKLCHQCVLRGGVPKPRGSRSSNWKGGIVVAGEYTQVIIYPDNPYYGMSRKAGANSTTHYVFEHRLVMAQLLGRCLLPSEIVHHKNGDKKDNRIENLYLTTRSKHKLGFGDAFQEGYELGYQQGYERGKSEWEKTVKSVL